MGNREALLESAITSLQQKGYAGTTARDVADGAGVSLGAIGYHFGTVQSSWMLLWRRRSGAGLSR